MDFLSVYSVVLYARELSWELLDLHKSKQGNTTNLNISFSMENEEKKELLRWDSNPRHTAYEAVALPTEIPRQLSWLG